MNSELIFDLVLPWVSDVQTLGRLACVSKNTESKLQRNWSVKQSAIADDQRERMWDELDQLRYFSNIDINIC